MNSQSLNWAIRSYMYVNHTDTEAKYYKYDYICRSSDQNKELEFLL